MCGIFQVLIYYQSKSSIERGKVTHIRVSACTYLLEAGLLAGWARRWISIVMVCIVKITDVDKPHSPSSFSLLEKPTDPPQV